MDTTREIRRPTNPLHGLWGVVREMSRIADATTRHDMARLRGGVEVWRPEPSFSYRGDDVVIRFDLADMRHDHIEATFSEGDLVIAGTCLDHAESGTVRHRSERCTGSFERRIALAPGVKPKDLNAQLENGVLEITVGPVARPQAYTPVQLWGPTRVPAPRSPLHEPSAESEQTSSGAEQEV